MHLHLDVDLWHVLAVIGIVALGWPLIRLLVQVVMMGVWWLLQRLP